jgi:hypothetical protein
LSCSSNLSQYQISYTGLTRAARGHTRTHADCTQKDEDSRGQVRTHADCTRTDEDLCGLHADRRGLTRTYVDNQDTTRKGRGKARTEVYLTCYALMLNYFFSHRLLLRVFLAPPLSLPLIIYCSVCSRSSTIIFIVIRDNLTAKSRSDKPQFSVYICTLSSIMINILYTQRGPDTDKNNAADYHAYRRPRRGQKHCRGLSRVQDARAGSS